MKPLTQYALIITLVFILVGVSVEHISRNRSTQEQSEHIHILERRLGYMHSQITNLRDMQDMHFLRMVDEAGFYKGQQIEAWRLLSKRKKK